MLLQEVSNKVLVLIDLVRSNAKTLELLKDVVPLWIVVLNTEALFWRITNMADVAIPK